MANNYHTPEMTRVLNNSAVEVDVWRGQVALQRDGRLHAHELCIKRRSRVETRAISVALWRQSALRMVGTAVMTRPGMAVMVIIASSSRQLWIASSTVYG